MNNTKLINKQWHPCARVKIRIMRPTGFYDATTIYEVFKKGLVGKRTTWLYDSEITLEKAIESYCKFKPLIDKVFRYRARPIESQWDRIILLDHYIRRLGIRESVIAAEILKDDGDLANCIA